MDTITITKAKEEDIPALVQLVNSAYRGEEAKKGWTHEADIIDGNLRIDEPSLRTLLLHPGSVILICKEEDNILGCVYLEKKYNKFYLGMLTVRPDLQNSGIGKRLLLASEDYARSQKIGAIEMTVINVRNELIEWYQRRGYSDTGRREPFPNDGRFGKPAREIEFLVLEKPIAAIG